MHRFTRRPIKMSMASAIAAVPAMLALSMGVAMAANPPMPQMDLRAETRGEAAIRALGSNLPAAAAHYGMTAERLTQILRKDPSSRLDRSGRLFYVEPAVDLTTSTGSTPTVSAAAPYDLSQTFLLNSKPGSTKTLYLDFDGHVVSGTAWNNGALIQAQAYDTDGNPAVFSTVEQEAIQKVWQRVAEDFAPFDVNVTTQDPGSDAIRRTSTADINYGSRVVVTRDNFYNCGCGGVAYVGTFNYANSTNPDLYQPAWVFFNALGNGLEKFVAEAASHEAGHNLGLGHDGNATTGYYGGHGTGETGWAPIMGIGYNRNLSQWSKGEYSGANNLQDDLAIIPNYGPVLRADDASNSTASPSSLTGTLNGSTRTVNQTGLISTRTDVDVYAFGAGAGTVSFTVSPWALGPNLDIEARLLNASGATIAVGNPADTLGATVSASVPAGTYMLQIDGVGKGDLITGYSDYGSVGQYTISGSYPESGAVAPTASFTAVPTSGTAPLHVTVDGGTSTDPDGSISTWDWNFGNGVVASGPVASHTYTTAGTYTITLTVRDQQGLSSSTTRTVSVSASAPEIYIKSLRVTVSGTASKGFQCTASATVQNQAGGLVGGATVSGNWSGTVSGAASATSTNKGVATIRSAKTKARGTCTYTMGNITATGYVYAPAKNVTSSAGVTY